MSETMKAVRLHAFGGPDVLQYEDAPKPVPLPGEALVRVRAASLNPPDLYLRDGYRALPPEWRPDGNFPLILGTDISGEIVAIGEGNCPFNIGDDVYAMVRFPEDVMTGSGAYAQYVRVPVAELALKPRRVDHVQAAGRIAVADRACSGVERDLQQVRTDPAGGVGVPVLRGAAAAMAGQVHGDDATAGVGEGGDPAGVLPVELGGG